MSTSPRRAMGAASLMVTVAFMATACTGNDASTEPKSDGPAASGSGASAAPLETRTTIEMVTGKLGELRRSRVKEKVAAVVDGWLDAAYVGGSYPRTDFDDSFPGFNSGVRAEALADLDLMSNAKIGGRIDGVEATKRRVRVDVLAVGHRAVGVTARFILGFDTVGDLERSELVKGRLYMTWHPGGWQVFGYDVTKGMAR